MNVEISKKESRYLDLLLKLAGGKEPLKVLWAALHSSIEGEDVVVPSSSDAHTLYRVNTELHVCTCPAGLNHLSCYHLRAADLAEMLAGRLSRQHSGRQAPQPTVSVNRRPGT
jgi:hypothetical protein